jgi:hypothetical protein
LSGGRLGEAQAIEGSPRWFETARTALPGDPQPGQLLAAISGIALAAGAFAAIGATIQGGWSAVTALPDYVLLGCTLVGLCAGVMLWSIKGPRRSEIEYLHDRVTTLSVDRLGDRKF